MEKNKGARNQFAGRDRSGGSKKRPPDNATPKLSDLGVTKSQSSRWQKLGGAAWSDLTPKSALTKTKEAAGFPLRPRR